MEIERSKTEKERKTEKSTGERERKGEKKERKTVLVL